MLIHERHRERERERQRQREKQAPRREPDGGLDPGSPGPGPGLKAGAHRLSPPGCPTACFPEGSFSTPQALRQECSTNLSSIKTPMKRPRTPRHRPCPSLSRRALSDGLPGQALGPGPTAGTTDKEGKVGRLGEKCHLPRLAHTGKPASQTREHAPERHRAWGMEGAGMSRRWGPPTPG